MSIAKLEPDSAKELLPVPLNTIPIHEDLRCRCNSEPVRRVPDLSEPRIAGLYISNAEQPECRPCSFIIPPLALAQSQPRVCCRFCAKQAIQPIIAQPKTITKVHLRSRPTS